MPKTCYCGLKSSRRICKYTLITPLLVCMHGRYTFSSTITIIREVQVNLSTRPRYQTVNTSSLIHQIAKPHKCHTSLELPSLLINIYFAQTTEPFFLLLLWLAILLLYEGSTFEESSKQLAMYIDFQLSGKSFKYIILKCLATVKAV